MVTQQVKFQHETWKRKTGGAYWLMRRCFNPKQFAKAWRSVAEPTQRSLDCRCVGCMAIKVHCAWIWWMTRSNFILGLQKITPWTTCGTPYLGAAPQWKIKTIAVIGQGNFPEKKSDFSFGQFTCIDQNPILSRRRSAASKYRKEHSDPLLLTLPILSACQVDLTGDVFPFRRP